MLVLGLVAATLLALAGAGMVGVAALTGVRAASAADLAALAGADVLLGRTGGTACGAAQRAATENGAELAGCTVHHREVTGAPVATSVQVEVVIIAPGAVGLLGPARVVARAGLDERDIGADGSLPMRQAAAGAP